MIPEYVPPLTVADVDTPLAAGKAEGKPPPMPVVTPVVEYIPPLTAGVPAAPLRVVDATGYTPPTAGVVAEYTPPLTVVEVPTIDEPPIGLITAKGVAIEGLGSGVATLGSTGLAGPSETLPNTGKRVAGYIGEYDTAPLLAVVATPRPEPTSGVRCKINYLLCMEQPSLSSNWESTDFRPLGTSYRNLSCQFSSCVQYQAKLMQLTGS